MFAEKVDEIQMMYRCMESFESDNNDREVKMKISTKGRYAIKLMLDLATYYNGEPVKIKDNCKKTAYFRQISGADRCNIK